MGALLVSILPFYVSLLNWLRARRSADIFNTASECSLQGGAGTKAAVAKGLASQKDLVALEDDSIRHIVQTHIHLAFHPISDGQHRRRMFTYDATELSPEYADFIN
jgi:hypothetical protein